MQMFGTRQVDQEAKYHTDMQPPEEAIPENVFRCVQGTEPGTHYSTNGTPGQTIACCIFETFDECQGKNDKEDQTQDNKTVPGTMQGTLQLTGTKDSTANGKNHQGNRDKDHKN